ncbi:hypothetical protein DPMN_053079 [Dreissena polymorpha]|uniref:Uncharacterized protein n=1 Tax=Dreissena polymorpha TaxID=45954 RepID=A0A9D4HRU5_DREPO|nr:hypothetical protein DPMN_053079 [Dreissena polymorpha]
METVSKVISDKPNIDSINQTASQVETCEVESETVQNHQRQQAQNPQPHQTNEQLECLSSQQEYQRQPLSKIQQDKQEITQKKLVENRIASTVCMTESPIHRQDSERLVEKENDPVVSLDGDEQTTVHSHNSPEINDISIKQVCNNDGTDIMETAGYLYTIIIFNMPAYL